MAGSVGTFSVSFTVNAEKAIRAYAQLSQEIARFAKAIKELSTASGGFKELDDKAASSSKHLRDQAKAMKNAVQSIRGLHAGFKSLIGIMGFSNNVIAQNVALGLQFALTWQISKIFKDAVADLTEFTTKIGEINTLLVRSPEFMQPLQEGLLSLPGIYGNIKDTAEATYQALSAGAEPAHAIELIKVASLGATAGIADLKTTVDVLTSIMNAYGLSAGDASKIMDQLTVTVEIGKTTLQELGTSLGNVVPTAALLKVGVNELGAAIAVLTGSGQSTAAAVVGLNSVLRSLLDPTDQSRAAALALGIEWNSAAIKAKGLFGILSELRERLRESNFDVNMQNKLLRELIGTQEGLRVVLPLINEGYEKFSDAMDKVNNSAGITTKMAQEMFKQFGPVAKAAINDLVSLIANVLMPVFNGIVPLLKMISVVLQILTSIVQLFWKTLETLGGWLGLTKDGINKLISAFVGLYIVNKFIPVFAGLRALFTGLIPLMQTLAVRLGIIGTSAAAASGSSVALTSALAGTKVAMISLFAVITPFTVALLALVAAYVAVSFWTDKMNEEADKVQAVMQDTSSSVIKYREQLRELGSEYENLSATFDKHFIALANKLDDFGVTLRNIGMKLSDFSITDLEKLLELKEANPQAWELFNKQVARLGEGARSTAMVMRALNNAISTTFKGKSLDQLLGVDALEFQQIILLLRNTASAVKEYGKNTEEGVEAQLKLNAFLVKYRTQIQNLDVMFRQLIKDGYDQAIVNKVLNEMYGVTIDELHKWAQASGEMRSEVRELNRVTKESVSEIDKFNAVLTKSTFQGLSVQLSGLVQQYKILTGEIEKGNVPVYKQKELMNELNNQFKQLFGITLEEALKVYPDLINNQGDFIKNSEQIIDAVKRQAEEEENLKKASEELLKAQEDYNNSLKELGVKTVPQIEKEMSNLLNVVSKMSDDFRRGNIDINFMAQGVLNAKEKLQEFGMTAEQATDVLILQGVPAFLAVSKATQSTSNSSGELTITWKEMFTALKDLIGADALGGVLSALIMLDDALKNVGIGGISLGNILDGIKEKNKEVIQATVQLTNEISNLIVEFFDLIGVVDEGDKKLVKTISSISSAIGAGIGQLVGIGPTIGGTIGKIGGTIVGVIASAFTGKERWQRVMEDVGESWGKAISEGLAKQIAELAEKLAKDKGLAKGTATWAAELLKTADIIRELGIRTTEELDRAAKKTREIFAALQSGVITASEAKKAIGDAFSELVKGMEETGQVVNANVAKIIEDARNEGLQIKEIIEFVNNQLEKASSAISTLIGLHKQESGWLEFTQNELTIISSSLSAIFAEAQKNGESLFQAFQRIADPLQQLRDYFQQTGQAVPEALKQLFQYQNFFNTFQQNIGVVDAIRSALEALASIGPPSAETWQASLAEVVNQYNQILAAGGNHQMALASIAPMLSTIVQIAQQYGLQIDENTQKLIDEARQNGLLQDQQLSMQNIMIEGFAAIIQALGGEIPAAWEKVLAKIDEANNRTRQWGDTLRGIGDVLGNYKIPVIGGGGGNKGGGDFGAQHGIAAIANRRVTIDVAEGGKPEAVFVAPLQKVNNRVSGDFVGNSGGSLVINLMIDNRKLGEVIVDNLEEAMRLGKVSIPLNSITKKR